MLYDLFPGIRDRVLRLRGGELGVAGSVALDVSRCRQPACKVHAVSARVHRCCLCICRACAIGNVIDRLGKRRAYVEVNSICPAGCSICGIDIPVSRDILRRRCICRCLVGIQAPTSKGECVGCCRGPGRLTCICTVTAVLNGLGVQKLCPIVVIVVQIALNVLVLDRDIRITFIHCCEPCSGDRTKTGDGPARHSIIQIVSVLIEASHRVKVVEKFFHLCRSCACHCETNDADTAVHRDLVQDVKHRDCTPTVLYTQCSDMCVARDGEIGYRCLVTHGEVGYCGGQVQCLKDAANRKCQRADVCSVKIDMLDIGTPRNINCGLGMSFTGSVTKSGAISHVNRLQKSVVSEGQRIHIAICIIRTGITALQVLQLCGVAQVDEADLKGADVADTGQLGSRVDIDLRVIQRCQPIRHWEQCRYLPVPSFRNEVRSVFDRRIDVRIRCNGNISTVVCTECDHIRQRITGIIF